MFTLAKKRNWTLKIHKTFPYYSILLPNIFPPTTPYYLPPLLIPITFLEPYYSLLSSSPPTTPYYPPPSNNSILPFSPLLFNAKSDAA